MEEKIIDKDYWTTTAWWYGCLVGVIAGVVAATMLCTYMWLEPAMECDKYKQIVAEQQAIIERYKVKTDTMMQVIDELSKEGGE